MTRPYWRGIPVDRLPASVIRGELARLHYAIDAERARIHAAQREPMRPCRICGTPIGAWGEGDGLDAGECAACAGGNDAAPYSE